jgi:hypothetical protein
VNQLLTEPVDSALLFSAAYYLVQAFVIHGVFLLITGLIYRM